jgi:hypothetical protein
MSANVSAVIAALTGKFGAIKTFIAAPPQTQPGDFVAVAWAGPDADAVTMPVVQAGARKQLATYDVISQVFAWQGNTKVADCIDRCYAVLDTLTANLLADKTLGGACIEARPIDTALRLNQTGTGADATLSVVVQIQNYL